MANLEQLQQLAFRANQSTAQFDRPSPSATVIAEGRALVREAKAIGLGCERVTVAGRTGYDCLDPVSKALFQVRVEKDGANARLSAAVHGIDRARRVESPLAKASRERDEARAELAACRATKAGQRSLFGG